MSKIITDPNLRERLIARLVTNDHSGAMRDEVNNTFVAVVDQYVLARHHEADPVVIEEWANLDVAQMRYSELCRIVYPGRFAPKSRAR